MNTVELDPEFVSTVVEDLPIPVRVLLEQEGMDAVLAGGFIRSHVDSTSTKDIDIFVGSDSKACALAEAVSIVDRQNYITDNALTAFLPDSDDGRSSVIQLI